LNNNRNNNRRRGRGNNRQPGGGQQLNRIDSRARGNAPQLLEKYRKLAHDAHLNGDRVQAEYFLQFADHYFRVIADTRVRQEEQRRPRDERFGENQPYAEGEETEFAGEGDVSSFEQPYRREDNRDYGGEFARDNGRDGGRETPRERDNGRDGGRGYRERDDRPPQRDRDDEAPQREDEVHEAESGEAVEFEATALNPVTRDNRIARGGLRPRRDREAPRGFEGEPGNESGNIDPSLLPPAIGEPREVEAAADEAPAPRKRGRPRKAPAGEGGEPLETVTG